MEADKPTWDFVNRKEQEKISRTAKFEVCSIEM